MERKIKFEDVVNFVRKAIKEKCNIRVFNSSIDISRKISDEKTLYFYICWNIDSENKLEICSDRSIYTGDYCYSIKIDDNRQILEWKLLIADVKDYYDSQVENSFNGFFRDTTPININDLDNEDD